MKRFERDVWVPEGTECFESSGFLGDLASSARVLRRAPALIVITLVLSLPVVRVSNRLLVLVIPFELVLAGFLGTQRVWFARLYSGDRLRGRDIWPITRSFIVRFVVLGVIVSVVSLGLTIALSLLHVPLRVLFAVAIGYGLVLDVALTFVVPALALTTSSIRRAWRIGLRMIRQTWPSCAWYVFTPGLTLVALSQALRPSTSGLATMVATALVTSALALWFKGAIVAFYLRRNPEAPRS